VNNGLSTLQFQSLSVSPHDVDELQGGTQDNGTWENYGSTVTWENTMIGDGGQSGFDVAIPEFRFHTFTGAAPDVNFDNGDIADWIWTADRSARGTASFYSPVISDPVVEQVDVRRHGLTAYRTKTAALGTRTLAEANAICNEWTGTRPARCGDWARLGPTPLTNAPGATARARANMACDRAHEGRHVDGVGGDDERARVHLEERRRRARVARCTWTRIDDASTIDPDRFVSSIYVDPANGTTRGSRTAVRRRTRRRRPGTCSRSRTTGHEHGDLGRPVVRLRRPAGQRPRP
jgi:hypothetical protein